MQKYSSHPNVPKFFGAFLAPVSFDCPLPWDHPAFPHLEFPLLLSLVKPDSGAAVKLPMPKLWIAMELCSAGSITDLAELSKPKPLPEAVSSPPSRFSFFVPIIPFSTEL